MPRMITVLEDCVRYRDGKKWKRRHCFLTKSELKKGIVTMFITKQFGISVSNQDIDEKSLRQYLIDEITGFEHGRHVDRESHVMALIGCNVVYCIAFEQTDTMFRWAETLNKLLTSVNFHVTLKKVSETNGLFNKITAGTQGNLHVQQNRLCLIGEPADGNKFICEWSILNLISIDIHETKCDKLKRLQIKSNGKSHKGKGHFEFEVSLTQTSAFDEAFRRFLTTCRKANDEFRTNFPLLPDPKEVSGDNNYSYSIICTDNTGSNSENSSSLEKRSSEIPIPRSREHSGPDQRPIENAQVKMRKSKKKLQKVTNELQKHYSTIETSTKRDNDTCLFLDDEEIEDLVQHKSQHLLCRGLSQESSGVCVSGPSDSMKDVDLSVHISVHDDSGCDNFSGNPPQSTSNGNHDMADHHKVLPQCRQKRAPKTGVFLSFYRDVCRNPLSLNNYRNYYRLLRAVFDKNSKLMKRSNSFNCFHEPDMKRFEFSRKYSNINFPLNLSNKTTEQHFRQWREKINRQCIDDVCLGMNFEEEEEEDLSKPWLSDRLPFRSMKEFHGSMTRSLQSGTVCFNMFSYHHFLSLLLDAKSVIKNIERNKLGPGGVAAEYKTLKDLICRKSKVYNHWLERMQSYSSTCDGSEPSIIDINILLVFQMIDSVLYMRSEINQGFTDEMTRHNTYCDGHRLSRLIDDDQDPACDQLTPPDYLGDHSPSNYLEIRRVLTTSSSTPDFRDYSQLDRVHKLSNIETRYQNLSSLDTFDVNADTLSKHGAYLNKPPMSDNKEGSFKRFRRKCSPNVFIPFIRRKTSSIHSTASEPMCHNDTKEQSSYYNIGNHRDLINKKSLSVVLDSCHYININQSSKSAETSKNYGSTRSTDTSDYANIDPSLGDDNTNYPDEIMDPSRNYGDLNFIKGRMRCATRHDSDSQYWSNFRRSSLSIVSQKSLQNYGTSRSSVVSSSKRGYSNMISRVHSDACPDTRNRFRSTDYINTKALSTSPLSLQSCCAGQVPCDSQQRTVPRSLNYVTVVENSTCDNFSSPLQVITRYEAPDNADNTAHHSHKPPHNQCKRSWLSPQSSPIVDYCQIDLNGTYALRDIDRRLHDKKSGNHCSPSTDSLVLHSFPSLEHIPDVYYSLSSFSHKKTSAPAPNNKPHSSTKSLRRIFSRKFGTTN